MQVILVSDLHAHRYKEHATTSATGLNSRLNDALEVLRMVRSYARKHGIGHVFFGGDLFHKRRILDVALFKAVRHEIAEFARAEILLSLLVGNHDQASKDGLVHSVGLLDDVVTEVIDTPGVHIYGDRKENTHLMVNWVPWMDDQELQRKAFNDKNMKKHSGPRLMIAHAGIFGSVTGPYEYVPKELLTPDDIPMDLYDMAFFGHYHKRQQITQGAWYIGSPLQTNRGERGQKKGFIVYDTKTLQMKVVPLHMPEFVRLTQEDIETKPAKLWNVKGNFIDVELEKEPHGGVEEFRHDLYKLGAQSVLVDFMPEPRLDPRQARVAVNPGLSFEEMTKKYVAEYGGKLDKNKLIEMAKKYLTEAEEGE